ncbi:hypothetical protein [Thermoleptolyngbya sp. C42_A2020_037]|uniref:hypothetical protein n=1 Tax=Thermoleptolyngbya sp. C42_A2020_037 TaxID=2747799 RepID=UPI001A031B14|nr:hypothetical protein [Thermoleptolyngbya sp. C42_A2020_037]MBF2085570.1 hypothetical protein [Thermoleptolyngbya sp. C42_A2020_037]
MAVGDFSILQLRQALQMAMFGLGMRYEKLGQSLGGGFVYRLGQHGFMPDVLFFRGEPRNRLYEYYLEGASEVGARCSYIPARSLLNRTLRAAKPTHFSGG